MATLPFDTGSVAVAGGAGWILVGTISIGGNRSGVNINIANSGNALTHLKLTKSGVSGGTHNDWIGASDSDWATLPAGEFLSVTPAAIYTLASAAQGQIHIGNCKGVQEIGVYAQAASDTNVRANGTASS